jgi:coenzyme F420-0:L-glutamate ligase/coenzyme F420-1:gamma-L-glutamate ligase
MTDVHTDSPSLMPTAGVQILPIDGIPDVGEGDDVAALIGRGIASSLGALHEGDIVVVTHKIVSKAEGGLIALSTIAPSVLATQIATDWGKDARQVEVVLRQAKRILRMSRGLIIAETHHGFICANAGVDASNVAAETVVILPADPDASAEHIRRALMETFFPDRSPEEYPFGVVITDSFGRPWRTGIVNVAIGVAGIAPLSDYRGYFDPSGYELRASILAIADELASAAELVMHKLASRPVAIVRGYERQTDGPVGTGKDLIMAEERNLFL